MEVSVTFGKEQFIKVLNDQMKNINPNTPNLDADQLKMIGKLNGEKVGEIDNVDLVVDLPVG